MAQQQGTPELETQAFACEAQQLERIDPHLSLRSIFGEIHDDAGDSATTKYQVIVTHDDGTEDIARTDYILEGIADRYDQQLATTRLKQQKRESLAGRARAQGLPLYVLENRREQAQLRATRRRALAPLRAKYGYSRRLLRGTRPVETPDHRPRSRPRAAARTGSRGARGARSPDRPRLCGCGCGDALPPGKRKYVDDTHAARQRKRDQRAKQPAASRLDDSHLARYTDAIFRARCAGALDFFEALELAIDPSERAMEAVRTPEAVAA